MTRSVEFSPLANALDYLRDGAGRLGETPSSTDLKYAVLHLHAGVEVLAKYRLVCEDWRLILTEESTSVTEQQFKDGDFYSIGLAQALKRLKTECGISLTAGQCKAANALVRFRNQLQHYGLVSTAEAVEARTTKVLGFALDFIDQHLPVDVLAADDDVDVLTTMLDDIRQKLSRIEKLVRQRMQQLQPALVAQPSWCPDCGQPAVLMSSAEHPHPVNVPAHIEPRCAFCTRRWDSLKDYVYDFADVRLGLSIQGVADGGDYPTETCPECGDELLVWFDVVTGERRRDATGRCFSCESEFNDRCSRCGHPVDNPEIGKEMKPCSECVAEFSRD
ncbi:hypothetical protein [Lentzea sp. NBRC 102530]|uniref:hypothetical protein n=1 Tax=Lentzea sp. NBRC 102530 TaxID=3032201 RepID=UPI0024A2CBB0|nr:hypothetical protein [Lentzea sp. NBRC 102530]GLY53166.1 hypothetical protein Lesp01_68220 [Lentzea sp. NBRC 102530]